MALKFARFAHNDDGASAIEFAIVAVLFMIPAYTGLVDVSQAVGIDRKVELTARTVADLASQATSNISSSEMKNILDAASLVIVPYDSTMLTVTASKITIDANGNAKIQWSCTRGGAAYQVGSAVTTVPAAFKVANTSLIRGEASYSYKPITGYVVKQTLNLYNQIYMTLRGLNTVSGSC